MKADHQSYHAHHRKRAFARRFRGWFRKLYLSCVIIFVLSAIGITFWLYKMGALQVLALEIRDKALRLTSHLELDLKDVRVEGPHYLEKETVLDMLSFQAGQPLFMISLEKVKMQLETIGWVKEAHIERRLPDKLYIAIEEREPFAIWQYNGILRLIDGGGNIITEGDMHGLWDLLILVGEDAHLYAHSLRILMSEAPELTRQISAAVRIGGRRWNVRFASGVEVKLPEENALKAWKYLAKLEQEKQVLARHIRTIDLRVPGRLFIQLEDDVVSEEQVG